LQPFPLAEGARPKKSVGQINPQYSKKRGFLVLDWFYAALASRGQPMTENPSATLPGTVEKIIKSPDPREPEKAQITVEGADHLYKEIRIENTLQDENGVEVRLKHGAKVEVTVEADRNDTVATGE
jgi:hypothetical protein